MSWLNCQSCGVTYPAYDRKYPHYCRKCKSERLNSLGVAFGAPTSLTAEELRSRRDAMRKANSSEPKF